MEGGWVKLYRGLVDWQWVKSPNHVAVFIQLLIRANYKETKWRMETIMPGQLLTGRKQLKDWTGLSEMQIRRVLDDLENSAEINRKRTSKFSIITIAKWEMYQGDDQQTTSKQPANNQQVTTSKKANKAKKERSINILSESPLSKLFAPEHGIQKWLLTGSLAVQDEILKQFDTATLQKEILRAYFWQLENSKRQAGSFLMTWLARNNGSSDKQKPTNSGFKSKTNGLTATHENPTGNPYLQEAIDKGLIA